MSTYQGQRWGRASPPREPPPREPPPRGSLPQEPPPRGPPPRTLRGQALRESPPRECSGARRGSRRWRRGRTGPRWSWPPPRQCRKHPGRRGSGCRSGRRTGCSCTRGHQGLKDGISIKSKEFISTSKTGAHTAADLANALDDAVQGAGGDVGDGLSRNSGHEGGSSKSVLHFELGMRVGWWW